MKSVMLTKFLDLAMERTARGKNGRKRKGWSPSFSFNFFFVSSSLGRIVLGLVEKFRQLTLTILILLYPTTRRYWISHQKKASSLTFTTKLFKKF